MKKKVIKWIIILAVVLVAICTIQILRGRIILPAMVQRVEFEGVGSDCEGAAGPVELDRSEIRKAATYHSFSLYAGTVNAEACEFDFRFKFYLVGGTEITVKDAGSMGIEVNTPLGKYWIKSEALEKYAQELIEKYGLDE